MNEHILRARRYIIYTQYVHIGTRTGWHHRPGVRVRYVRRREILIDNRSHAALEPIGYWRTIWQ